MGVELTIALYSVGSSLLTLVVVALVNTLRTASSLPRRVARLEDTGALTLEVLDAQTDGIIAVAEAVSGKQCNGNIDHALDRLRDSKESKSKFLAKQAMGQTGAAK